MSQLPRSQLPIPNHSQRPTPKPEEDAEEREKVIVRSNGVVTYVGKDIAYQFWKLGLLGPGLQLSRVRAAAAGSAVGDVEHRRRRQSSAVSAAPSYVYNVIDVRQSYLQKLLKQALIAVGHPEGAQRSHHFSYEMVALSHATARELGFAPPPDSEDAKRPFVEVSGRKGLGVKADDLLDTVIKKAGEEVAEAQRRAERGRGRPDRADDWHRRRALLPDQVLARQGHRVRSRGGAQLPGRKRAVHPVRHRPHQQHLPQAAGTRRPGRGRARGAAGDDAGRRADRRERTRAVVAGARGRAAGRSRRTGRGDARILGAGQVRVRACAGVQRVLQPSPEPIVDSQRRTRRRAPVARGGASSICEIS